MNFLAVIEEGKIHECISFSLLLRTYSNASFMFVCFCFFPPFSPLAPASAQQRLCKSSVALGEPPAGEDNWTLTQTLTLLPLLFHLKELKDNSDTNVHINMLKPLSPHMWIPDIWSHTTQFLSKLSNCQKFQPYANDLW